MSKHHQVVIVGGGTAGLCVAARLRNLDHPLDVAIIEPSDKHYYQPMWTLVGGGVFPKEESMRDEADFIPDGATWIRQKVASFEPKANKLTTDNGDTISYDVLVVAPGIQINWGAIKGLKDALGKDGVCSNYAYETVDSTWRFLKDFKGGNAVFTYPATPIKCAGAPQKIMWLAEHHLRRSGVRRNSEVIYGCATPGIFGIPRYKKPLSKLAEERGVKTHFMHNLIEVRAADKVAVFENLEGGDNLEVDYNFLHVTPPMSAPDFIKSSPLASEAGWVDVDKHTTQHVRFRNVFSLGDASSLPCSKTGAAIRKQAPVTVENIEAFLAKQPLKGSYDGYASCPLVTGYGRLILAEFGYDGVTMETFPFDQTKERYSMWLMKTQGLPSLYWHGMLRGRA